MKKEIKDLDEVVFEYRNQNYGAFFLRRSYNKNVTRALFFALFLSMGMISIPLIASYMKKPVKINIDNSATFDSGLKQIDKNDIEEIKPQNAKPVEKIQAFTAPQIVIDSNEIMSDLADLMDNATNRKNIPTIDTSLIIDEKPFVKPIDPLPDQTFLNVSLMPEFKGGEKAMYAWLRDNVRYPRMAQEVNISGTVHVQFVIEKDGSITNIKLLNDIGGSCGDEALRAVKTMPKWNEGRQNNVPVRVQLVLPIKFILE